jgi:hypothetical protein
MGIVEAIVVFYCISYASYATLWAFRYLKEYSEERSRQWLEKELEEANVEIKRLMGLINSLRTNVIAYQSRQDRERGVIHISQRR